MKYRPYLLIPGFLMFLFFSCKNRNHADLEVPDCCGTGNNLTPLGSLVYGPWAPFPQSLVYNVSIYYQDSLLSSYAADYSEEESNLVFKLMKDGDLQRWSKKDYIFDDGDKTKDGTVVVSHNKPDIRNVYSTGKWTVNFKDSTLIISSGSDQRQPINIHSKYIELGSDQLKLVTSTIFDTTMNGKSVRCKKILTKYYTHPWIDGFE